MNEEIKKINVVGHDDVLDLIGINVVAIQIAEGGAMGRPGGVFFVTSESNVYFTYLRRQLSKDEAYREMTGDDIIKIIPEISSFKSGMMGHGVEHPAGWYYEYLGMGNHLLVKSEYEKRFLQEVQIQEDLYPDKIHYNLWLDAILNALKSLGCSFRSQAANK